MNLFALTSNPGARIVRFPLTQELQEELKTLFAGQRQAFMEGIVDTVIPPFLAAVRSRVG